MSLLREGVGVILTRLSLDSMSPLLMRRIFVSISEQISRFVDVTFSYWGKQLLGLNLQMCCLSMESQVVTKRILCSFSEYRFCLKEKCRP